jgi:hypothetical protein
MQHSSIFGPFVSYKENKVFWIGPEVFNKDKDQLPSIYSREWQSSLIYKAQCVCVCVCVVRNQKHWTDFNEIWNVKDHDLEMVFVYVWKISDLVLASYGRKNLSWPNLVLYRKFHKTNFVQQNNSWVCWLFNLFDLATPWLSRAVFHITAYTRGQ